MPLNKKIQVEMVEEKLGAVQTDAVAEKGTIVNTAVDCEKFTALDKGKTLYFKAWAVDIITEDGQKYYFINEDSDAICAIELTK